MSPTSLIPISQTSLISLTSLTKVSGRRTAPNTAVPDCRSGHLGFAAIRRACCALSFALIYAAFFCAPLLAQDRSSDELHKFNESVDSLIKKVSPSVVQILVTGYGTLESAEHGTTGVVIGRQRAIGSGFVIDPDGYIITNAHVVSGAQVVQVVLSSTNSGDNSLQSILSTRTNIVP